MLALVLMLNFTPTLNSRISPLGTCKGMNPVGKDMFKSIGFLVLDFGFPYAVNGPGRLRVQYNLLSK